MSSKLEAKLQELRDELELLTSMVRAERLTATAANQQCTDEQGERAHKVLDQCIAFASVPQQDVGADRYTGEWENGFFVCRDMSKPEGSRIFYMSPESEAVWIERLNAAFAAGRSVPSPVGQEPVAWNKPGDFPPPTIPPGHIMIGYSNRKAKDEDYSLRQLACYPPKGPWTDWYGVVPNPDRWAIIPIPDKDEARWHMPKRDIQGETYTTILVNAIQLPDHEKTRLVKDLCERGAHPPKAGVLTDEEIDRIVDSVETDLRIVHGNARFDPMTFAHECLRYARDNGYLNSVS